MSPAPHGSPLPSQTPPIDPPLPWTACSMTGGRLGGQGRIDEQGRIDDITNVARDFRVAVALSTASCCRRWSPLRTPASCW